MTLSIPEEAVVDAVGLAERPFHRLGDARFIHCCGPELGFDAAQAAELPDGRDEGIEQVAFFRVLGLEAGVVFVRKFLEFSRIFIGDDSRLCIDA